MDPVLDPLLGRLTIKKGKYIKIGDKEVEYHPDFRLILQVSHRVFHSTISSIQIFFADKIGKPTL